MKIVEQKTKDLTGLKKQKMENSNLLAEMKISYRSKDPVTRFTKIGGSKDAADYLRSIWDVDLIEYQEEFICLFINNANGVIGWQKISCGGMTGTVADPKVIFSAALLAGATKVILSHNHPSGNLEPSYEDIDLTKRLVEGGRILDVTVLDHIIITRNGYYSLSDEGVL